ncbi:hypothetical protein LCGC14_1414760 [marine sediment metagenome]|uniref:LexA repressor DNA-binding domain-containing protein n=1 Tax=marine sediment metagenome TaxID=412755 RepID=A0A0F9KEA7_9ZZZZ
MEKPQPPSDLWEQLDAVIKEVVPFQPPDSFTIKEYRVKYGIPRCTAQDQVQKLCDAGKLEKIRHGNRVYFRLVNGKG